MIPGGDEGIISLRCITWQNLRIRANRRTPVRLFVAVRTLAPPGSHRFVSLGIIKCPAWGHFIIPGGDEGIRTLDTVARIHDFESRAFDHSATSPMRDIIQNPF